MEDINRNIMVHLKPQERRSFRGALTHGKLTGISVLNPKRTILKTYYITLFFTKNCWSKYVNNVFIFSYWNRCI